MRVGPAPEELRRNSVGNWGPKDLSLSAVSTFQRPPEDIVTHSGTFKTLPINGPIWHADTIGRAAVCIQVHGYPGKGKGVVYGPLKKNSGAMYDLFSLVEKNKWPYHA
jgi:hypothetical protein